MHPQMIAVGSDDPNPANGGKVFIYEYNENSRRWTKLETISSVVDPVHDIAFSPNLGRSYHILAVATKDVRIINLTPVNDEQSIQSGVTKLDVETIAQFEDHNSLVWRVCWNLTGTVLCSTGDDGCVRMFKMIYINSWKPVAVLKGDSSQSSYDQRTTSSTNNGSTIIPFYQTARYIKLGSIAQTREAPWH